MYLLSAISSCSSSYSASFSIIRPRYFTCLVCVSLNFAPAELGGLSLFSPDEASFYLITSEFFVSFSFKFETSLIDDVAGRLFFGLSLNIF